MKKFDNQNQPFICDRATGEKIPVAKEVRDAYYGEAARVRMKAQAHGQCICPQSKVWACDGDCLVCEYRRSGDMASLDIPVGEDGEDTLLDMVPDETPAIESIIADRDLLDRLFARLRELDPDADTIIAMWQDNYNITDTSAYESRLDAINRECGELSTLINALLQQGSKQSGSLQEINRQYEEYVAQYDTLQQEKQKASTQIAFCRAKRVQVGAFLAELEKRKTALTKFDPLVWQATLNYMKVNPDCTVTFVFRDGTELTCPIEPGVRQYKKRKGTEEHTDGK